MAAATRIAEVRSTVRDVRDRVRPDGGESGSDAAFVALVVLGSAVVFGLQVWRLIQIYTPVPPVDATVGVVATAVALVGLWPVAGRLGVPARPALGAVLLGGALTILLDAPAPPAGLAALFLTGAAVLAVLPGRAYLAAAPVALLGVLAAPVAAVALLAMGVHMVATRALGNTWSPRLRWAACAGGGVVAVLVAVLATGDRLWAVAGSSAVSWVSALVAAAIAVVAVLAWRRFSWLRPVATATVALCACALVPGTTGPILLIAAPVAAVLAVVLLDDHLPGDGRRVAAGLGAVLVLLVTIPGLVAAATPDERATPASPVAAPPAPAGPVPGEVAGATAGWLLTQLDPGYLVAAAPDGRARLAGQGFPLERMVPDTPLPDRPYVLVVPVDAVVNGTALLARFPDPAGRGLEVRVPTPTAPDAVRFAEDRVRFGEMLAANPRLELTPPARGAVVAGTVDPRLTALLAGLSGPYRIGVDGFPTDPAGPPDAPSRAVTITTVDGAPTSDPVVADVVRRWVDGQNLPLRPELDLRPGQNLVLRFPAPSPAEPVAE